MSDSDSDLSNLTLQVEGEALTASKLVGQSYNGSKYRNMIAFNLSGQNVENKTEIGFQKILLPENWGERGNFMGVIIEAAADGGSYNKIFCQTVQ